MLGCNAFGKSEKVFVMMAIGDERGWKGWNGRWSKKGQVYTKSI